MTDHYCLTVADEYGYGHFVEYESPYDAKEQLLDALDRCVSQRSVYEVQALLSEVEDDIAEMEGDGEV